MFSVKSIIFVFIILIIKNMKPRHRDLDISDIDPFANCKLNRKANAVILNKIIESYKDGFTLALNGEWGTGKTTFLNMWQKELTQNGYKTIYLNAWENDFVSEPLVSILGELKSIVTTPHEKLFDNIKTKASKFSKGIIPAIAKGLTKKYLGEDAADLIDSTTKVVTEVFKNEISDYEKKKIELTEFKSKLQELVNNECENKPLVFVVDELDRCRPDYAVELLEKIKHFFSIEGVVFVLSIDKTQLCSSIKGYYGSSDINAEEYLRRFIDIEYSLSDPEAETFCNYLYGYFEFDSFMQSKERMGCSELRNDKEMFLNMAIKLVESKRLTLRQTEKLFAYTRLILISFQTNSYLFADLFFLMSFIKQFESVFYDDLKQRNFTIQELSDKVNTVFVENLRLEQISKYSQSFTSAIAKLLFFYNNDYMRGGAYKNLIDIADGKADVLTFNSGGIDQEKCARIISHYQNQMGANDFKLSYLIERINLSKLY